MKSYTFSGHESFPCRQYWLKKGYDFKIADQRFNAPDAVVNLGVGKNMVSSIRYWLRAFDILDENEELTELANNIFSNDGWDPFLEDEGTLWLLHYALINKGYASIYKLIFSELRKQKPEFSRRHFYSFIEQKEVGFNERTLRDDFSVFTRTYIGDKSKDIEEGYSGFLTELNLLKELKIRSTDQGKEKVKNFYNIEPNERMEIPSHVILFAILKNENYSDSISFDNLYLDKDSVGNIFALNKEGLINHLESISKLYPNNLYFNNDPLIKELQFKNNSLDPWLVLNDYYTQANI